MAEHFFKRTSHHLGRFWSIKQSVVYEVSQNNNDKTCPQYHLSKSTNSNDGLDIADPSGIPSERVSQNLVKIKLTVEFFEARIKFYTGFPATRAVFVAHQPCITCITFVKLLVEKSKRFTTLGNSISGLDLSLIERKSWHSEQGSIPAINLGSLSSISRFSACVLTLYAQRHSYGCFGVA